MINLTYKFPIWVRALRWIWKEKTIQRTYHRARARLKITSQNSRPDLGQIWSFRLSETTGIAGYFEDFASEKWPKMTWKWDAKMGGCFERALSSIDSITPYIVVVLNHRYFGTICLLVEGKNSIEASLKNTAFFLNFQFLNFKPSKRPKYLILYPLSILKLRLLNADKGT